MNPVTHFFAGWTVGLPFELSRRDRVLVTLASVSPDVDGLPVLFDFLKGRSPEYMELWSKYHHAAHNILFAGIVALGCMAAADKRRVTAGLAFFAVHLHYLCDIAGSRGPDGYQWPIAYLGPFSDKWNLAVPWQWELNAWPNFVITTGLMSVVIYYAWQRGYSPVGIFSRRTDGAFVDVLRKWFGR